MAFQKEVTSQIQAVGNAGQIAKASHDFLNVECYIAGDDLKVGEFAQSSVEPNEARATNGVALTGSILGVVVRDSLKNANSTNASLSVGAGNSLQIINAGNVFIETDKTATKGQYVFLKTADGSLAFDDSSTLENHTYTGWRVFIGNDDDTRGVVGITTSQALAGAGGGIIDFQVGDLVLKNGSVKSAGLVSSADLPNALGILAYIDTDLGQALVVDLKTSDEILQFTTNDAIWWNNSPACSGNAKSHASTNAGGNAPAWYQNLLPNYREVAIAVAGRDDIDSGYYPVFDYAKSKGASWFIPNIVTAGYINENLASINATLQALSLSSFAGNVWTTSTINENGNKYKNMSLPLATLSAGVIEHLKNNVSDGSVGRYDRNASQIRALLVQVIKLKKA